MRRYWVDKKFFLDSNGGQHILLQGNDFKHICVVCRMDIGSQFEVLPGDNKAYFVKVVDKKKKQALVEVINVREISPIPMPYIELCISLPKFKKFEHILEKAVELGVSKVRPFFSDFSFIVDSKKLTEDRFERFQKIIKSATQQSGRGQLMSLEPPCTLDLLLEMFNQQACTVGLFAYEGASQNSLKQELKQFSSAKFTSIWSFIGSEGGFSDKEVKLFSENQLKPISLGDQVLRVETACLSLASILKYELVE